MECVRRVYKYDDWVKYIAYLKEWAETHAELEFAGESPACYNEWFDNEYNEEDEF